MILTWLILCYNIGIMRTDINDKNMNPIEEKSMEEFAEAISQYSTDINSFDEIVKKFAEAATLVEFFTF